MWLLTSVPLVLSLPHMVSQPKGMILDIALFLSQRWWWKKKFVFKKKVRFLRVTGEFTGLLLHAL